MGTKTFNTTRILVIRYEVWGLFKEYIVSMFTWLLCFYTYLCKAGTALKLLFNKSGNEILQKRSSI